MKPRSSPVENAVLLAKTVFRDSCRNLPVLSGKAPARLRAEPSWEVEREVGLDSRKRIAAAIRDYIARERISREQFAFKTKLGKSTVDKLLTGLFSERTLAIVESHTGLKLRE